MKESEEYMYTIFLFQLMRKIARYANCFASIACVVQHSTNIIYNIPGDTLLILSLK